MIRRIARAAATITLALAITLVGFTALATAAVLSDPAGHTAFPAPTTSSAPAEPAAAAPSSAAVATPNTPTQAPYLCWVEHKPAADGGDETVCGDPAHMPTDATPLVQST